MTNRHTHRQTDRPTDRQTHRVLKQNATASACVMMFVFYVNLA